MISKILTFNVRGLQDDKERKKVFNFLKNEAKADIVMIQESHNNKDDVNEKNRWGREWGSEKHIYVNPKASNSGGTLTLLNPGYDYNIIHEESSGFDGKAQFFIIDNFEP